MNFLDDQGNLFGIVNVIDALVVLFVVAVVVAGVAFVTQPGPASSTTDHQQNTLQATLLLTDTPPYIADAVQPGMTATSNDEVVGHVTKVDRSPSKLIVTDQNGTVHAADHPTETDLAITAELVVQKSNGDLTFEGKPLQIGQKVTLNLGNVTIEPTVTSM